MAEDRASSEIARLVTDHYQAVYKYAYRLAGVVADAEDLTQQVFLTAQQKLDQLRNPERVRGWLFSILRSHFLRTWQGKFPATASNLGLDLDSITLDADDEDTVDPARLQEAINEISAEFRVVLAMFYFEECSYKEIAAQLDLPMGTVMSRLARAKQQLRARLFEPELPRTNSAPARR